MKLKESAYNLAFKVYTYCLKFIKQIVLRITCIGEN